MTSLSPPRTSRALAFAVAGLALSLVILATLQYQWLGEVSTAEQARMHAADRTHAQQFARDFDREVTRAFLRLQIDPATFRDRDGARYAARYRQWAERTDHGRLVKDVFLVDGASDTLLRFQPEAGVFQPAEWPGSLAHIRAHVHEVMAEPGEGPRGFRRGPLDLIDDEVPGLVMPIASFERRGAGPMPFFRLAGYGVIVLDLGYIQSELLPALVRRHFGSDSEADYAVRIERRTDPKAILFQSHAPFPPGDGDGSTGLLELRPDEASEDDLAAVPSTGPSPGAGSRAEPGGRDRTEGRRDGTEGGRERGRPERRLGWNRRGASRLEGDSGHWRLVVAHRAGSVDEVVAAARRRNLAVSAGILVLLAGSMALIVLSAQRARRLAERQIEFVAGVSHELRTPVAVICSAGENLADGVVQDGDMVRQYGRVLRDEGRRLAEMVEQVLDFAGSYSGRRAYRFEEVDVAAVLGECLEAAASTLREAEMRVESAIEPGLPAVKADRSALRRAVQNLVQNAIKYGRDGRLIEVRGTSATERGRRQVRITVEDHGLGIPPAEVDRVFEPFYRGEEAENRQIRGSGLGLSLVKRIAEAHGGRVHVASTPGRGSAFTLTLPAWPSEGRAPA
jgi:signal transduction histidine kinase